MNIVAVIDPGSLTPAPLERNGQGVFIVKDPIVVTVGFRPFIIPSGFETDGATIPFWARWIFNAWGRAGIPSILHDFLREQTALLKWEADQIFFLALRACGVSELRASLMYLAVRTHKSKRRSA